MTKKQVLCSQRLRRLPRQFSWVDQRLVREGYIRGKSAEALALYLFLLIVADLQGLSYYSDASLCSYLPLNPAELQEARRELLRSGLIAYRKPLYQVLSLDKPEPPRAGGELDSIAQILRNAAE